MPCMHASIQNKDLATSPEVKVVVETFVLGFGLVIANQDD